MLIVSVEVTRQSSWANAPKMFPRRPNSATPASRPPPATNPSQKSACPAPVLGVVPPTVPPILKVPRVAVIQTFPPILEPNLEGVPTVRNDQVIFKLSGAGVEVLDVVIGSKAQAAHSRDH